MTHKYRITFRDGKQATMLDPEEKSLPKIQDSVMARFGRSRVKRIERTLPEHEPPPHGGFPFSGG